MCLFSIYLMVKYVYLAFIRQITVYMVKYVYLVFVRLYGIYMMVKYTRSGQISIYID